MPQWVTSLKKDKDFDREEYPLKKLRELPAGARQCFERGETGSGVAH